MTLVQIRCKRCRTVLHEVTEPPADWAGALDIPPCARCRSVGHDMGRHLARNRREGVEPSGDLSRPAGPWETMVALRVQWEQLRPAVEAALATGRVQQETI